MAKKKVYIETYGCQMNLADTEIVFSILKNEGFEKADSLEKADVALINACSVRENAERKVIERLKNIKGNKKRSADLIVGVIGCMAERMRGALPEKNDIVKIVAGPDEYRKLPALIERAEEGDLGIAVKLSRVETYEDIEPLRTRGVSAWLAIMRGCDNFCSYCIVPYVRGRERSRSFDSLLKEVEKLAAAGFKEITLLGQNVNSYKCPKTGKDFPDLLAACSELAPEVRFRFATSHPKDISDKLIATVAERENVCEHIHLAMQSGSNAVLKAMNRKYTIEEYLEKIDKIRALVPKCSLTTDIIAGFPGETLKDHEATLEAMRRIRYDGAYTFRYSVREGSAAAKMPDDVPEEEKIRRLNEIIDLQQKISLEKNKELIGKTEEILIDGESSRGGGQMKGRTDGNKTVVFEAKNGVEAGSYAKVLIKNATSATLFGELI